MRTKIPRESLPTMMRCRKCGKLLPAEDFELYPSGTRRHVCNKCKYLCYSLPAHYRWCMHSWFYIKHSIYILKKLRCLVLMKVPGFFMPFWYGLFRLLKPSFLPPETMLFRVLNYPFWLSVSSLKTFSACTANKWLGSVKCTSCVLFNILVLPLEPLKKR